MTLGALAAGRLIWRKLTDYDLRNKTVLITGGSRGLGLVLAREFAHEGAHVAICARDEEELVQVRLDLRNRGADVITFKCDVTNPSEVANMVNEVRGHFGKIDVLVNNAGTIQVGPIEAMNREDFEKAMQTHFWAPLNTMLAVIPEMRERGDGRIVNISSIGGKIAVPHLVPYSASKFALVGLSKGLHGAAQGRHQRYDCLPRPDAHRESAQRELQGQTSRRVRMVQHQRFAAVDGDQSGARGEADHRRVQAGTRRVGDNGPGEAGGDV